MCLALRADGEIPYAGAQIQASRTASILVAIDSASLWNSKGIIILDEITPTGIKTFHDRSKAIALY